MVYNLFRVARVSCILIIALLSKSRVTLLPKALQKAGPIFIKFGQSLSCRPDLVGSDLATSLLSLCDNAKPYPFAKAKAVIEKELKKPIASLFAKINETPVGAASIAQVHKAETLDGKQVAVKVLRPKVEGWFRRDTKLILFLASIIQKFVSKRLKLQEVVKTFEETTKFELDLRFEAANCVELKENTRGSDAFYIPEVHWNLTARRVLTTEWIEGKPISKVHHSPKIASDLAIMFFQQAYRDGFFHGDLHPGNLIVTDEGKIAPVDFGIMGRLDEPTRVYMAEILRGFINKDYQHVADIHYLAGYVSPKHANFASACRAIGEPIVGKPSNQISIGDLLGQLFKITADFDMEVQTQLLLLQKNTVLIEGVCSQVDPSVNLWQIFAPHARQWAKQHLTLRRRLCQSSQITMVKILPEMIRRYQGILRGEPDNKTGYYLKAIYSVLILMLIAQILSMVCL